MNLLEIKNSMQAIGIRDRKNYQEDTIEVVRYASRGVVIKNNRILLTQSTKYGDNKIPGGGVEDNEGPIETLIREVHEETGYRVITSSIKPFGYFEEKRKGLKEDAIFHQVSFYYFCDVEDNPDSLSLTSSEIECGYHPMWKSLDEAIKENEALIDIEYSGTWISRELEVLKALKAAQ